MFLAKFFLSSLITLALFSGSVSPVFAHDSGVTGGRENNLNKSLNFLVSQGNLTQNQVEEYKNAMKTKLDERFATKLNEVLKDLINKNSLTQLKADAIQESVLNKRGLKDLVNAGTITKSEALLIRSALKALPKEDIGVIRNKVLADLVTKNILTQTQADALNKTKQHWGKKLGKHHGADLNSASNVSLTF